MFATRTCLRVRAAACAGSKRWLGTAAEAQGGALHARLKADLKAAMRGKDKTRLAVIKGVLADIVYVEKSPTGSAFSRDSDADVAEVVQRALQRRRDSVQAFADGGRQDLAGAEAEKIGVLASYLPAQLSTEQIEERARATIARLGVAGAKGIGPVMREIGVSSAEAPRSEVAQVVKRLLG
ncbi:hypothetical protein LPJ61_003369 [Coemansia biformis]|uniref:Altered inheritance of mitochondria protein 41 n=1 Tax=Coemansia biformis TaxID=1286918 RepID=A0A9W7YD54_9FUNG|nr:hypothetical protein LPJ61_003369 [Coemansia biformis]